MDSILNSVKKKLGITEDYTPFDEDIMMCINSVFPKLWQIGLDSAKGFIIEDETATWDDLTEDKTLTSLISMYINSNVKIQFDPPTSSILMDALTRTISEYEWRISVYLDPSKEES